ncbi:orotidine-5'-phosphate decarboxylase [Thiospirochaeta perfilievii]|uniref:Orotidine 5'-phosphate decarboxylase n=2 Tax=Thiospirochaeta perfilievii TaxID=252967 RepID=A0A5C1QH73_9SPIO|nr:orotidine-5'-phosphate decarboxylase [Thiospirochaeta perfilievii]
MSFMEQVKKRWVENNTLVCVGLDPDVEKIPAKYRELENPLFAFNKDIIDATAQYVCCYKPQIAYYNGVGLERDLELTINYIHESYPGIPVILDAKRGDIGSTAQMYVKEAFTRYKADSVTVNPYMGGDTLEPFLEQKDKATIILCRTSNPGAVDLQDLEIDGKPLYMHVASKATNSWNRNKNILLVVGATYPEELKKIREVIGDIPFLTPGIGAQGGDVEKAVKAGTTPDGTGMIINSSRGIIYAEDPSIAAKSLRDEINLYR